MSFENIIKKLNQNSKNFDHFTKFIRQKEIISELKPLLSSIKQSKYYLSAWTLYLFPDITMNKNIDKDLYNISKKIALNKDNDIKESLELFIDKFEEWKKKDKQILLESIFMQYHQFGVDLLNAENEDDKEIIKQSRLNLLKTAKQLGGNDFVNEIKSFKPLVLNKEQLENQFQNAFWDKFTEEYKNNDFSLLLIIIEDIKNVLTTICPTRKQFIEELLDKDFIKNQLKDPNACAQYFKNLIQNILNLIKDLQSPAYDNDLKEVESKIDDHHNYPYMIREITKLVKNIVVDLQNLK